MLESLNNLIDTFIHFITSMGRTSKHTHRAYATDLHHVFMYWTEILGHEPYIKDFNQNNIRAYLANEFGKVSKRTLSRRISSLRTFGDFLKKSGKIEENPALEISMPKLPKTLPHPLAVEDMFAILNAAKEHVLKEKKYSNIRDLAILEILYGAGLRRSEAANLNLEDLMEQNDYLVIFVHSGKGGKDRFVPAGPATHKALKEYLKVRNKFGKKQDPYALFLNKFGDRLSDRSIDNIVRKYALLAGLNKKISPHTLRHTFATHLLDNGANIRVIQEMLGHSSANTTQIYTKVSLSKIVDTYIKTHPRS